MSASFHPSDEALFAYGAGSLDEATALLIATHATFCPQCRTQITRVESLGGSLLNDLPPEELGDDALSQILGRLDEDSAGLPSPPLVACGPSAFPKPLQSYLGTAEIHWKRLAKGVEQSMVLECGSARARLLRIAPGTTVPEHGHQGSELTLVLQGGFSDLNGHYVRGDVSIADGSVIHTPVADQDGPCVCLAVTDAPLRLTGVIGRLISPFLNI